MKNLIGERHTIVIASLLPLVAISIVACDEAAFQAKQRLKSGSLLAVEQCVTRNASDLVPDDVIRNQCVAKHQESIYLAGKYGTGGFNFSGGFSANIRNISDTHILTGLRINVDFKGDNPTSEGKEFRNLWVMPGESIQLEIARSEIEREGNLQHLSGDTFNWNWADLYGIEIDVN